MSAPDLIEPLIGYRAWHLGIDGALTPWSVHAAGPWSPGPNTAVCHVLDEPDPTHRPPVSGCSCGIYALARLDDPRLHGMQTQAVGAIAAWGDIEMHRTGYRAQHAAIVALALPDEDAPSMIRRQLELAAARYRVALVPRDELHATACRFGAPIDPRLVAPMPARGCAPSHVGETGIALPEHVWARPGHTTVQLGITRPFAGLLADDVELTLPPRGTDIAATDPLALVGTAGQSLIAWASVSGVIAERNERVLADPSLLREHPEGGGWLVRIAPSKWVQDERRFCWGRRGAVHYAADIGRLASGVDVFEELRAERVLIEAPVTGPGDILRELERRLSVPRYESSNDVYATCGEQLAERLAADRARAVRAARANVVLRYVITEPTATMTLVARDGDVRLVCGPCELVADYELAMTAEIAGEYFAGRVDIARALRNGEIASSVSNPTTLRTASLLKELLAVQRRR